MDDQASSALTAQPERAAAELRQLGHALTSCDVDPLILTDFREALNHVRHSAWALQQAIDLQARKRETFGILSLLTDERIRVTANMAEKLVVDLPAAKLQFTSPGLERLRRAIMVLSEELGRIPA